MSPEDGSIYGTLVAGCPTLNLSYMLPSKKIFSSIQERFQGCDLRFPGPESTMEEVIASDVAEPAPNISARRLSRRGRILDNSPGTSVMSQQQSVFSASDVRFDERGSVVSSQAPGEDEAEPFTRPVPDSMGAQSK